MPLCGHVHMCVLVPTEDTGSSVAGVTGSWQPLNVGGRWEMNSGPLLEQQALLNNEPSPQPKKTSAFNMKITLPSFTQ